MHSGRIGKGKRKRLTEEKTKRAPDQQRSLNSSQNKGESPRESGFEHEMPSAEVLWGQSKMAF